MSAPNGPVCWVATTNAWPIHIRFHDPAAVITIGIGHAEGCTDVPDDSPIKKISEADIPPPTGWSGMSMPDMSAVGFVRCGVAEPAVVWAEAAEARKNNVSSSANDR